MKNILCFFGLHKVSKRYYGYGAEADFLCIRPQCSFKAYSGEGYYPSIVEILLIYIFVLMFASPIIWFLYKVIEVLYILILLLI